jgi:hypothetical protein
MCKSASHATFMGMRNLKYVFAVTILVLALLPKSLELVGIVLLFVALALLAALPLRLMLGAGGTRHRRPVG